MDIEQRKQEILAKRAKLAELRKAREQRADTRPRPDSLLPTTSNTGRIPLPSSQEARRRELDELIDRLIDRPNASSRGDSPAGKAGSRPSSTGRASLSPSSRDGQALHTPPRGRAVYTTSQATQTEPNDETVADVADESTSVQPLPPPIPAPPTPPPPKQEVIMYSVAVQTSEPRGKDASFSDEEDGESAHNRSPRSHRRFNRKEKEREDKLRQQLRQEIEEELKGLNLSSNLNGDATKTPIDDSSKRNGFFNRALTGEEMEAVVASDEFLDFVNRSSKVIERALDEEYDVLVDYAIVEEDYEDDDDEEVGNGYGRSKVKKGRRLREIAQFYDERWCKKRMVSDINFSPKFPELLLASYTKNASAPQDPSGLLQIWNTHLSSRAEYTFHSTSDILTAKFSPFHPSLIIGGCYSGQVALWDMRSKSTQPVQKTRLSGANSGGHTHPVYSVDIVGTQNANNIISCSTDGVVCAWSVDMLAQPQEYLELTNPHPGRTDEISPTCAGFPPSDPTSFLIGTEDGTMYPCHRYDRAGSRAGIDQDLRYKSHTAPIMSLNFHSAQGPVDLSDLVLTSSLDWTVKLWKVRPFGSSSRANAAASARYTTDTNASVENISCLTEFSREEVVYDARWAPQRPGVFATVDGSGSVEVWDLLVDTEIPVAKATPASEIGTSSLSRGYGLRSLNKVAWDEKDGKRMAVGGAAGIVTAYEVGSDLAGEGVKGEDWASMKKLVGRMERGLR